MRLFHFGENKNRLIIKESKYYVHHCVQDFLLLFMSLSTVSIVKKVDFLVGIYFILLKNCHGPSLKVFRYQVFTSVERLEK